VYLARLKSERKDALLRRLFDAAPRETVRRRRFNSLRLKIGRFRRAGAFDDRAGRI
jgi:hypothetical protein